MKSVCEERHGAQIRNDISNELIIYFSVELKKIIINKHFIKNYIKICYLHFISHFTVQNTRVIIDLSQRVGGRERENIVLCHGFLYIYFTISF